MKFVVESTCVADWFPIVVSPPESSVCGFAISTSRALPPR